MLEWAAFAILWNFLIVIYGFQPGDTLRFLGLLFPSPKT